MANTMVQMKHPSAPASPSSYPSMQNQTLSPPKPGAFNEWGEKQILASGVSGQHLQEQLGPRRVGS